MVEYIELDKGKDREDKNKYKVLVGKEYINIHLTVFSIIMIIIIIVGYAWLFNYYKDVSKSNYVVITCKDQNTGKLYEEHYNSVREFEDSETICGLSKNHNVLWGNPKVDINFSFH